MRETPLLNVMRRAAERAAKALRRDFGEVHALQVSRKGPADFVSRADTRAEQILQRELQTARPDYGFLMEESGHIPNPKSNRTWVIDPLDGTSNFLHGIPHFAISVALREEERLIAAFVLQPLTGERFSAELGLGAFCNDRRMRVAARKNPEDTLIATGFPFLGHDDFEPVHNDIRAVMPKTAGLRRFGAAALDLAWVADGRFDAFWQRHLKPWDWAAGALLVQEAGGLVTEAGGKSLKPDSPSILAANEPIHRWMLETLNPQ
ncbi:MAG: inositol monophosphatase [Alphaproteobacteria bacterium]|nr:inositol monophosphatase [Alphaproteobacteria bacterium]MDA7984756.1 inositol monophosphatase [Alphaproteobacteria bacterium]MDA7988558.1 inositol monophosphatase [Alphaproteobacteria bacterium]